MTEFKFPGIRYLSIATAAVLSLASASAVWGLALTNVAVSSAVVQPHMAESTNLVYTVDETADVTVWVRNTDDLSVRTLCDSVEKTSGSYSITWDGKDTSGAVVAAGAYTIWLRAESATEVKDVLRDVRVKWPGASPMIIIESQDKASGIAYPGSALTIKLNGTSIGTTTAALDGSYSLSLSGLQDSNTLVAEATNPITNVMTSDSYTFPKISSISVSPNPFDPANNETATISYSLPATMDMYIWIVDEVNGFSMVNQLLANQSQSAGSHSVEWDGTDVSGTVQCAGRHSVVISGNQSSVEPGEQSDATTVVMTTVDSPGPRISNVSISNVSASSVTITWNTHTSSDSLVKYGTMLPVGSQSSLDQSMVTSHSITLNGLTSGQKYYFMVVSKDANGDESQSGCLNQFQAINLPAAPSNLQATPRLRNIKLAWTAGGADTAEYKVFRGTSTGFTCDAAHLLTTVPDEHFQDTRVITGTTYYYKVQGVDANQRSCGTTSESSAASLSAPTTVAFLEAEGAGSSAVWTGNWSTVTDAKASGGQYRQSDGGGSCAVEFTVTGPEFALIPVQTSDGGLADVYVDGEKVFTMDCNNSGAASPVYQESFVIDGLSNTTHTIRVQYSEPVGNGTKINVDLVERHIY